MNIMHATLTIGVAAARTATQAGLWPTLVAQANRDPMSFIRLVGEGLVVIVGVMNFGVYFSDFIRRLNAERPNLQRVDVRKDKHSKSPRMPLIVELQNIGKRPARILSVSLIAGDMQRTGIPYSASVVKSEDYMVLQVKDAFHEKLVTYFSKNGKPGKGKFIVTYGELSGAGRHTWVGLEDLYFPSPISQDNSLIYWTGPKGSAKPDVWDR